MIDTASDDTRSAARGTEYASFVVTLIGLALAIYLTIEHYTGSKSLVCPENTTLNCQKVTTSAWSHVGPVPVALLGLIFFVGMTVLCSPYAWRWSMLDGLRVLGAVVGVLSALYLVWAELFRVDAICLFCTGVHLCSLLLLGLVLWTTSEKRSAAR